MSLNRIVKMLMLCSAALALALACAPGIPLVAQVEPTATRRATRAPRATFTPRPVETDTPIPEPTEEPTEEPQPTEVPPTDEPPPTVVPTRAATRPPQPTAPPAPQPTQPPPATVAPQFPWRYVNMECLHSGGVTIFVRAYGNVNDPNSNVPGISVRASYAPDGPPITEEDRKTQPDSGRADFTLSVPGVPPVTGTFYVWIVNNDGQRQSDISPPININGKSEDAPDTCWQAYVNFVRN
jgi:hypothetical protein